MSNECQFTHLNIGEKSLEVLRCPHASAAGTIVLLHEALGSVSYWKDFPGKLASATGCNVVAYSRAGHGGSQGPLEPRSVGYYRNQVEVVLPAIFRHFKIESPILYGHSEGAAIAFLFAAEQPHTVRALIAEAPIVTTEARSQNRIHELAATYSSSELRRKLARYHCDSDAVFHSWIAGVTTPQMLQFPLHEYLAKIVCPVLVLQGPEDEFGGEIQLLTLEKHVPQVTSRTIAGAGHLPHREQTEAVLMEIRIFLADLPSSAARPGPLIRQPGSSGVTC
ncbi:MAG TPA: alpha/beta hydrolase [Acidobacteriaceae bacterium]|nr:alpha/beta hydrolase [Acidobacteriaceae bacterium]